MARLSDTRNRIIDKAADLLMRHGYNGFSYRDISTHLGVKNAAVHYHFPSKSDLGLALVREYQQVLRDQTSEFMAYGGDALPQLEGLFRFTEQQFCNGRCICPLGAFAVDFTDLPDEVRAATEQFMSDSVNWLTKVLETGRDQGEFNFEGDAGAKALSILAGLSGARQMARIHGPDVLGRIIDQTRIDLGLGA
ncbi:MAG: TetR family transcriptional regulator [Xanthomonadales bacterium]|nr:TetR/AcrR family transcriptional regulator [Xanthomonadales bacterium]NIX12637.1 TetR family transcriptional regulator [Xanthomonadales bacterium]